jgi:hypothetical protein
MSAAERARYGGIESELIGLGGSVNPEIASYKAGLNDKKAKYEELLSLWPKMKALDKQKNKGEVGAKVESLLSELGLPNWKAVRRGDVEKALGTTQAEWEMDDAAIAQKLGKPLYTEQARPGVDEAGAQPYSQGTMDFQNMFRDILTKAVASDMAGGSYNPEQLANATKFVDDTFTASGKIALDDFDRSQRERAASLGRDPNMDFQAGNIIADQSRRLGAERGAQIANRIDQTAMRGLQTASQGLGQLANQDVVRSSFLNDLSQKAFNNRVNLLNQRTGIGNIYQNERFQNVSQAESQTTPGQSGGLLGGLSNLSSGVSGVIDLGKQAVGGIKGILG